MNRLGALDALTRRKLQKQVLDIWESHRQAVMMITHDVDEAIYMSDRIVMMTNGPHAKIGGNFRGTFSTSARSPSDTGI
jgi:nitrate/nitrite transport system ATP-binding protein